MTLNQQHLALLKSWEIEEVVVWEPLQENVYRTASQEWVKRV